MLRAAVFLGAILLLAPAGAGAREAAAPFISCPAGVEGYTLVPNSQQNTNPGSDENRVDCYYASGTIQQTLSFYWLLPTTQGELTDACASDPKTIPATVVASTTHNVVSVAGGFTPDAAWRAVMAERVKAAEPLSLPCPLTGTKVFKFRVQARADAVHEKGLPSLKLYATSDVKAVGSVTVNYDRPDHSLYALDDQTGTIQVRHEFLSDQLPDITFTLVPEDGGYFKQDATGATVVQFPVVVKASSLAACKGANGQVSFGASTKSKGAFALMLSGSGCDSSIGLIDGKGPKGADPTNRVTVKIG